MKDNDTQESVAYSESEFSTTDSSQISVIRTAGLELTFDERADGQFRLFQPYYPIVKLPTHSHRILPLQPSQEYQALATTSRDLNILTVRTRSMMHAANLIDVLCNRSRKIRKIV